MTATNPLRIFAGAVALALAGCAADLSTPPPPRDDVLDARIDAWAQAYVDEDKLSGLVTLVHKDGKTKQSGSYGFRDLDSRTPMARDTIFRIFSMTKPITSVAAMMLVEEGKIGLDDPITDWMPEFSGTKVFAAQTENGMTLEPVRRPFTLRDLLTHTAGFTYGVFDDHPVDKLYLDAGLFDFEITIGEFTEKLARLPLRKQPGTGWHYSVATDVTGHLIERVSGMPLDEFFRTRIFEPLGMKDTHFYLPDNKTDRFAEIYAPEEDGAIRPEGDVMAEVGWRRENYVMLSGGGGLVSTLDDYLAFCRMLLGKGEVDGARLLEPETVALMTRNHLPEDHIPYAPHADGFGFGLGFSILMDEEKAGIGSQGEYAWSGAASTLFWVDPEEQLIVILMTQMTPSQTYPLRAELRQIVYESLARSPSR